MLDGARGWMVVGGVLLWSFAACDGGSSNATGSSGAGASDSGGVCPGTDPWPEGTQTCRSDGECDASSFCAATMPSNTCGGCVPMLQGCSVDGDCGSDVCEAYDGPQGPCNCEPAMVCVPNCNTAGCDDGFACDVDGHCAALSCATQYTCPSDQVCDATAMGSDVHGCAPQPCSAGYACGENQVCESASTPGADGHGCRPLHCMEGFDCGANQRCVATPSGNGCVSLTCDGDSDCDCGVCVKGVCSSRIGACFGAPS